IWDCMSSQEVVTFVRNGVFENVPLEIICERTMDHCLASDIGMSGVGCDNMTMVIVAILNGRTSDEWYEHIAKRVAERPGPADDNLRPNGDEDPEAYKEKLELEAAKLSESEKTNEVNSREINSKIEGQINETHAVNETGGRSEVKEQSKVDTDKEEVRAAVA
ncbi:Protein phosphatase 2C 2, partial [Modicella reniformis]